MRGGEHSSFPGVWLEIFEKEENKRRRGEFEEGLGEKGSWSGHIPGGVIKTGLEVRWASICEEAFQVWTLFITFSILFLDIDKILFWCLDASIGDFIMLLWNLSSFASMLCLISNLAFNSFTPTILNCSPLFLDCLRVILDAWSILTHSLYSGKFWEKFHHMLLICGVAPAFLSFSFIYHSTRGRILSANVPLSPDVSHLEFYPTDIPPSPDVSQPQFCLADIPPSPVISHPAPAVGWERRTIQLPRVDMSGSFGNAYPECALNMSVIPILSSWGLNHQTSRLSLLSA